MESLNTYILLYTGEQIEKAIKFCYTSIAPLYNSSSTYNIDDFVIYDGLLYQCTTNIVTAEAFNVNHWELQKIFDNDGIVNIMAGTSTSTTSDSLFPYANGEDF